MPAAICTPSNLQINNTNHLRAKDHETIRTSRLLPFRSRRLSILKESLKNPYNLIIDGLAKRRKRHLFTRVFSILCLVTQHPDLALNT